MQRNRLVLSFFLLFTLLCASCEDEKNRIEKPNDLLERKSFETILYRVYMIEGDVRFRLRSENFDSLRMQTTVAMNEMYRKNNTTHEQFMKSYAYYMNDPDLSSEIMKKIVNQLIELQAKEEAKQNENDTVAKQNENDSIAAINKLIQNLVRIKDK